MLDRQTAFPGSEKDRLSFALDLAWKILLARTESRRMRINKESSMQLHYASILHVLGETFCTRPDERFSIELESGVAGKSIDLTCVLGTARAAVEMKCFRKSSKRAVDTDMYDVLKDISRLCSCPDFQIRRFICLTDNPYYVNGKHDGHASVVTIKDGTVYASGTDINPTWIGKWKDSSRDHPLHIGTEITLNWSKVEGWYSLYLAI